ncbi:MAG TPA: hypothetical protein VHJ38_02665 [Nitrososphaeraceae archaeon]|jgi:hypothetical protein|nr:hypothetical protein [Nitrososphaeraceae archaeon]
MQERIITKNGQDKLYQSILSINNKCYKTEKGNCHICTTKSNIICIRRLKNIERLEGHPTVLWTGGGYHVYQPIEGIIFEKYRDFNEFKEYNLFNEFLRFFKNFLSNNKAKKNNNPSLKSCLIRIPGSTNSKYNTEVKIIQKWDGYGPHIRLLIGDFHAYLIDCKLTKGRKLKKYSDYKNNFRSANSNTIPWIEKQLQLKMEVNMLFGKYCVLIW